ncbi:MAG TPA: alcohol dehydrogenase catalytic domain-containing protein [Thermoanaerobaculia bacterium]|nr:alcohol dehydrogenase catalytic domain-containing protein [Thermoanaerobaculia bacterium]
MSALHKYVGTIRPYRRLGKGQGWGDYYVHNEKRSGRKHPLHPGSCPFCGMAAGNAVRRLTFQGEQYLVIRNNNPIVEGQLLFTPAPKREHRLDVSANDVLLALSMARSGFSKLRMRRAEDVVPAGTAETPWACYVNAFPGTGRSVAHLHINCVPAHHVPLPPDAVAPWQIGTAKNGTAISRHAGVGFYALVVENDNEKALATTIADLHRRMNEWQQPYNLLVYPAACGPRVVMVPRDSEYCEAADQRVAGLEFLTGILIPGTARLAVMDTTLRDRALAQATLGPGRQLTLERMLRGVYGLPEAGQVVQAQAVRGQKEFQPMVRPNTILSSPPKRPRKDTTGKKRVFGKIDPRFWVLPQQKTPKTSFHDRRVDANVLVRITRASICQSDRRVLAKKKHATLSGYALGHEGGGYIVDPGPWSAELAAGEKVVVLPHLSCGGCSDCQRYMSNLCGNMEHLGFHLHGSMANLMAFPYQCVLPAGPDFPDDALPLVEPLACVLRALFRIRIELRRLEDAPAGSALPKGAFTIYGAGPMGMLTALAVRRNWKTLPIRIVEPNASRRAIVERWPGFEVVEKLPPGCSNAVTFVASSNFQAAMDAIRATDYGGTLLLFSGINTSEQEGKDPEFQAKDLELIHRREQSVLKDYDSGNGRIHLIGSSGYILDDVMRSIRELRLHYASHYRRVQNVRIEGLHGTTARLEPPRETTLRYPGPAVETLLSPGGVNHPDVAQTLKVLIRL